MSGWTAPLRSHVTVPAVDADMCLGHPGCREQYRGYRCTRRYRHDGRHLATGGRDDVYAAWPGTHEPTAADLTEVPS